MAQMIYAQIKDGVIKNVIVLEDEGLADVFKEGFDAIVRIDELDPVPQVGWSYDGSVFSPAPPMPIKEQVFDAITTYQDIAPKLLAEIYTANRLAGLTTVQSDKLFDQFADVVLRISQGAFPTALFRLSQKVPEDFVTQELLDSWISKLKSYM